MPRTNRPSRKDGNHSEVVTTLEQCGWSVSDTSAVGVRVDKHGHATGALDLFAAKHGVTVLVEVKAGKGKLNANETAFWEQWKGEKVIARSGEEAVLFCEGLLA